MVIVRQHVLAELVERLVVLAFLQVGEFVDDDHPQELRGGVLEQGSHADFLLRLELAALHPRDRGVQAEGTLDHVELVVVEHLVQARRVAQVFLLEVHGVGVQRLVALHIVTPRVAALEVLAQAVLGDQLADLVLQRCGIGLEVLEGDHARVRRFAENAQCTASGAPAADRRFG